MMGMPLSSARSWMRQIFCDCTSEKDPPSTVKSWAKTATRRPLILPKPATTPSPGKRLSAMPKSVQLWVARAPISWNEPSSSSNDSRSRAVSLPLACLLGDALGPAAGQGALAHLAQLGEVVGHGPILRPQGDPVSMSREAQGPGVGRTASRAS